MTVDGDELGAMPSERLVGEISELAAHINAASCRWLLLVGELDRRGVWADWGCRSCAHWLSYRCGLSPGAGREQLRVAKALSGLPVIRAAFGRGELCYSQVRALTRIATAETEADLVVVARHATAGQLEVIVRAYRGVLATAAGAGPAERYVRCSHDEDGSLLIRARLPAEEGALVLAALEAGRDSLRAGAGADRGDARQEADAADTGHVDDGHDRDEQAGGVSAETTQIGDSAVDAADGSGGGEAAAVRQAPASSADALVLMAETLLAAGAAERSGGESYQVVVHVDAATLAHDHDDDGETGGVCQLDRGGPLHPETARRLASDASLVRILERDGRPLSVGRKTRAVPPALRRALAARDPVCRFPGCPQRRYLHAHHLHHWARGGPTDLSNLVRLCSHHHRLVHEHGYTIEPAARGRLRFRRPDSRRSRPRQRTPPATQANCNAATPNKDSPSTTKPAFPPSTPATGSTSTGKSQASSKPTADSWRTLPGDRRTRTIAAACLATQKESTTPMKPSADAPNSRPRATQGAG